MEEATVCHLLRENGHGTEVLLGERNKLFCRGIWNGPGGRKWRSETPQRCVRREVIEEIGTRIAGRQVRHFASVDFYYLRETGEYSLDWRVHYFQAPAWEGDPVVIDGFSRLGWFPLKGLPFELMMPDQEYWMPAAIAGIAKGKRLVGSVRYGDKEAKTVKEVKFEFIPI